MRLAERRRDMFAAEIDDLLRRSTRVRLVLGKVQLAVLDENCRGYKSLAVEPQAVVEAQRRLIGETRARQHDGRGCGGENSHHA